MSLTLAVFTMPLPLSTLLTCLSQLSFASCTRCQDLWLIYLHASQLLLQSNSPILTWSLTAIVQILDHVLATALVFVSLYQSAYDLGILLLQSSASIKWLAELAEYLAE